MSALTHLTLSDAARKLAKGEFSSKELTQAHIDAMAQLRGLNAYITETPEKALAMAEASDQRRRSGKAALLEGLPIAIKDLFCTEGTLTTAGSHILDGFHPTY